MAYQRPANEKFTNAAKNQTPWKKKKQQPTVRETTDIEQRVASADMMKREEKNRQKKSTQEKSQKDLQKDRGTVDGVAKHQRINWTTV